MAIRVVCTKDAYDMQIQHWICIEGLQIFLNCLCKVGEMLWGDLWEAGFPPPRLFLPSYEDSGLFADVPTSEWSKCQLFASWGQHVWRMPSVLDNNPLYIRVRHKGDLLLFIIDVDKYGKPPALQSLRQTHRHHSLRAHQKKICYMKVCETLAIPPSGQTTSEPLASSFQFTFLRSQTSAQCLYASSPYSLQNRGVIGPSAGSIDHRAQVWFKSRLEDVTSPLRFNDPWTLPAWCMKNPK